MTISPPPAEQASGDVAAMGPCIDWQWAVGRTGPRCRRGQSCGAHVPDLCPLNRRLAVRAYLTEQQNNG